MMSDYREYTVKVKDLMQDITHTVHELATSQDEANSTALVELRKLLGHDEFEIV